MAYRRAMARIKGIERRGAQEWPDRQQPARPAEAVLALQRMAGNRAVRQLLRCKDKDKVKRKTPRQLQAEQMAQKSAKNQKSVKLAELPQAAQDSLRDILAGTSVTDYLRPNDGKHSTDPETGLQKASGVGVREYHTKPYNESWRLVVRTAGHDKRAYWDGKHTAGTYTYHRIEDPPFPAPAPAPVAPAPAPVVVPAAAAPAPALVPAAAGPVPDSWDE
jgi:hypothetical protein